MPCKPRRTLLVGLVVSLICVAVGAGAGLAPAGAQSDASSTGTVEVVQDIRSLNVDLATFDFADCQTMAGVSTGDQLTLPNGYCVSPSLTVTNGSAPAEIHIRATDMIPAVGGGPWARCSLGAAPGCTGPAGLPGVDQAHLARIGQFGDQSLATNSCDLTWGTPEAPTCQAAPHEVTQQEILVVGPSSSTSTSPTFSTTVTWSALPV